MYKKNRLRIFKIGNIALIVLCFLLVISGSSQAQECPPNITNYWNLDETSGTTFSDSVGGINASCSGGSDCPDFTTPTNPGRIENALVFDGSSDGINVPDNASFDWSEADSFSIEFWMRTDSASTCSGNQVIIGRNDNSTSLYWWAGCWDGGEAAFILIDNSGGGSDWLQGTTDLTDGNWHHIVAVRDAEANEIRIYVDGIKEDFAPVLYSSGFESTALLNMGHLSNGYYFAGTIDEVALYNRALSDTEVQSHYYIVRGYCNMCILPITITPLGDSITWGNSPTMTDNDYIVGYRQKLYLDLINAGYDIDFVGSLQAGSLATPPFDIDHEGHPGYRDDQVADNVYNWLVANPAEIALLHIGTNELDPSPNDVEDILNNIDAYDENITVVLARIINQATYNPTITEFNDNVEAMANNRISNGDKIIIVDMESALNYEEDMDGNTHPNMDGYNKMADVWLNALNDFLPVCSSVPSPPIITSNAITLAAIGQPYTYDVQAAGNPVPTYSLITAPSGMTINESTGLIQWTPLSAGIFDVTVVATNSEGFDEQNFTIQVLACQSDMSHYWKLDETEQPYVDFYGGNNATCTNCPSSTLGIIDGAQEFSIVDQVSAVDDGTLDWGVADSFSVEFWLKTDAASTCSGNQVIVGRNDDLTSLYWWVGCWDGGKPAFILIDNSGVGSDPVNWLQGTTDLTDGSWHHIVVVRDASTDQIRIYVNGMQEDSANVVYSTGFDSTAPLNIGHLINSYHFIGTIDEIAIYNKALSLSEIQEHYTSGSVGAGYCTMPSYTLDVSGSGSGTGTVTGSGINCSITNGATSGDCSEEFNPGTDVTLTASAESGSTFSGWSGDCSGTGSCNLTMDSNKSVTAQFMLNTYTLTINGSGNGSGTVTGNGIDCAVTNGTTSGDCLEDYETGTIVTLTANANSDSVFDGWSGGSCSGTGTCVTTMNVDTTVTAEFTGIYFISGTIGTMTGRFTPLEGATVELTGDATQTVKTDRYGKYTFAGLSNGNYTITPVKAGYSFNPVNRSVTVNNANITGQDFACIYGSTVYTYTISGRVTNEVGNPLPGVPVALSGNAVATTTTDGSGNYIFAGLTNGEYSVKPDLAGYTFSPTSRTVIINSGNITGQNFVGTYTGGGESYYSISGTIVAMAGCLTPLGDVTVELTGDATQTVKTDRYGKYTFAGLSNGNYTITPVKAGYSFNPVNRTVTVNNANITGQDFSAKLQ